MDCRSARRLLDQGVGPGPVNPLRAELGFHLASCANCRAYRRDPGQLLLAELLAEPRPRRSRRRRRRLPAQAATILLVAGTLLLVLLLARTALALFTIQRNVAAMRLPTSEPSTRLSTTTPATSVPAPTAPGTIAAVLPPAPPAPSERPAATAAPQASATPVLPASAQEVPNLLPPTPAAERPPSYLTPITLPSPAAAGAVVQVSPEGRRAMPTLVPTAVPTPPLGSGALTVLLLGVDQRPDETYPSRADAIAVARIDPGRQRVALLSLPRDLIVAIPGYGYGRINSAAVIGELNPELGGGVALTKRTVSSLLGLPIDYVVQANFEGAIGAIDAIGGVEINVERELYDPQYPTMDYGYTIAHFLPGPQHMNGTTALMYGRVRHMDSDFERMKRQQAVLVAALTQVRQQNLLSQVESLAAISTALRNYIHTDLTQDQLLGLAWALRGLRPESVERYVVDGSMVSEYTVPGDPFAQLPVPGAIEGLAQQLLNGPSR